MRGVANTPMSQLRLTPLSRVIVAVTLLFVLSMYLSSGSHSSRFTSLGSPVCRVGNPKTGPLLCSHRGYHQPWTDPESNTLDSPVAGSGLLDSIRWLHRRMGISCFDLDLVVTFDGHIIVAHPDELSRMLNVVNDPSSMTYIQIKSKAKPGATSPPLLSELLDVLYELRIEQTTLEPKGSAQHPRNIRRIYEALSPESSDKRTFLRTRTFVVVMPEVALSFIPLDAQEPVQLAVPAKHSQSGPGFPQWYCEEPPLPINDPLQGYKMIMPSRDVMLECDKKDWKGKYLIGSWLPASESEALDIAARSTSVTTDFPAAVAPHCRGGST
ncbi:hypothetical protein DIPPA_30749 [Diplonema papillatum]|nr:hypothetical protein DIPPA_30749 [Diplonema papillatum]